MTNSPAQQAKGEASMSVRMSTAYVAPAVDRESDDGSNGSGTSENTPDSKQDAVEMRQ